MRTGWLRFPALVAHDSAFRRHGFPGLAGWGRRSASLVLAHYGSFDDVPDEAARWDPGVLKAVRGAAKLAERLAAERELAELFRVLATLRLDPSVLDRVASLEWRGPTAAFEAVCRYFRDPGMAERAHALAGR